MIKLRDYYFKRESTISDADTVIVNLDLKDPVSALIIEYEATNGASAGLKPRICEEVSAIELVDGADVIECLDMAKWRAQNFYDFGHLPHAIDTDIADAKQEQSCIVNFGRFIGDSELYIDPSSFHNLQLRLTHSFAVAADTGFATGTGKVTIKAVLIEEGASPNKGYLMSKELYSFTSVTSGDEPVDMPVDYPYKRLMIQADVTLKQVEEVLTKMKLSCDADKYIVFNNYTEDLVDACQAKRGFAKQVRAQKVANAGTVLTDIRNIFKAGSRTIAGDNLYGVEGILAERVTFTAIDFSTPGTPALLSSAEEIRVDVEGLTPYALLDIPFGEDHEISTWFNAPEYGNIKMYLTQALAASCSVILQQLRR